MLIQQYTSGCEHCDCTFRSNEKDRDTAVIEAEEQGWAAVWSRGLGAYLLTCRFCTNNPDADECPGCK